MKNKTEQSKAPAWTPGSEEIAAYKLGISEAHHACGMTYDDDPESPRSVAYDWGRNVGEIGATGPANWKALIAAAPEMAEELATTLDDISDFYAAFPDMEGQFEGTECRLRAILARLHGEGGAK